MVTSKVLSSPDFRHLFESVPNLYLVLSPALLVMAVSDAYLRATLTKREEITGRHLFDIFPDNPDDPKASGVGNLGASLRRVLQTGIPDAMAVQKYDIPLPDSEGGGFEVRYWSPLNTPIIGPDGRIECIIHRVEDVTEFIRLKQQGAEQLKLTEELRTRTESMESEIYQRALELQETNDRLREAERLKSEFFANISHELRTPLSLILAPVESLLADKASAFSADQQPLLQTIHNNSIRLLQMINGLLDFSKSEAGKMKVERQTIDIYTLTRSVLFDFAALAEQKQITLTYTPGQEHSIVRIDPYLFEHILFNLLSNALKFTPAGGSVTVVLTLNGSFLLLSVSDTGIGIREEDQASLFQKFRQVESSATRKYEGTGLGLAMVKEFAGLLKGTVKVKSAPGKGAVFTVECYAPQVEAADTDGTPLTFTRATRLPVSVGMQSPDPDNRTLTIPSSSATPAFPHLKVLICEDNEELAAYIDSLLREICLVRVARNGQEGLREVKSWTPDLVLSDVMMPVKDGITLCKEIKEDPDTSSIVVVLLTALAQRESLLRGWEAQADEYLFKPFHSQELTTRIRSLLKMIAERKLREDSLEQKSRELAIAHADLTQKEKLNGYARALERSNKELEDFAYISAHDMKSPVTSLNGLLTLMDRKDAVKPEHRSLFEMTRRSARQMQTTVKVLNDTIAFRKSMTPLRERLEINPVLDAVKIGLLDALAGSSAVILEDFSQCPMVFFPSMYFQSILQNLLSNAIKYRREGVPPIIHIKTAESGDDVVLTVKDNGMGMDLTSAQDKIGRLFQRFHTHAEGMGVGLYLVRSIVEFFEGRMEIESNLNSGTTFIIYLGHAKIQ